SVLGLSIFGATAALPGINIIQNGSFESIVDGGVALPPWHFDPGFTAIINEPQKAADGGNFVGLPGFMWQDLATELGQAYRVSYSERGDFNGSGTSVLYVFLQGQFVQSHLAFSASPWSAHQFEF